MSRHGRRDLNHAAIREALRACGVSVWDTGDLGDDFPDLVCGRHGETVLMEIKSPGGKERPGQASARLKWRGGRWVVVRSVADALAAVGLPSALG
jgi:hypothetical protein